jgi:gliding motility-associated-like protein
LKRKTHIKPILILAVLAWMTVFHVSGQYSFVATPATGCEPLRVKFHFTSSASVDTISSFYWDFGNGQTSTLEDPDTVVYSNAGTYTPALVFNNRADLLIVKPDYISVHHTAPATFTVADTLDYATFVFTHTGTLDATATYTGSDPREVFTFPAQDTFSVILTLTDDYGCVSTSSAEVVVIQEIKVQNVFTPNGDNVNDYFMIISNTGFPLRLKIFTRAGILVFEVEGLDLVWDGTAASGQKMSPGVYFYTLESASPDPKNRYAKSGILYMYK